MFMLQKINWNSKLFYDNLVKFISLRMALNQQGRMGCSIYKMKSGGGK